MHLNDFLHQNLRIIFVCESFANQKPCKSFLTSSAVTTSDCESGAVQILKLEYQTTRVSMVELYYH